MYNFISTKLQSDYKMSTQIARNNLQDIDEIIILKDGKLEVEKIVDSAPRIKVGDVNKLIQLYGRIEDPNEPVVEPDEPEDPEEEEPDDSNNVPDLDDDMKGDN